VWIIYKIPLEECEDESFRQFIQYINPKLKLPQTVETLKSKLEEQKAIMSREVFDLIRNQYFGLTSDCWTSSKESL
jgi:hypothetical protein